MSDNFHQSVKGGTGANHIMFGHGDAIWFSDGKGKANSATAQCSGCGGHAQCGDRGRGREPESGSRHQQLVHEDGYGGGSFGAASYGGGSYSNCADTTQPGVAPIVNYLKSLPTPINPRCEAGHYYLLNNYNPGYFGNGNNAFTDTNPNNTVFTIPPSSTPSIGDTMLDNDVSWKYYGDQWNNYVPDPYQLNYGAVGTATDEYCNICNPFQYDTSIMANATIRTAHIQDTANLYSDIKNGNLAGSFDRQAERPRRRTPGLLEAQPVRRLHQEDRR